jgi:sortase A
MDACMNRWPEGAPPHPPTPQPKRENLLSRSLGAIGFALDAFRRRRAGRMTLWGLVLVLTLSGTGLLAYPFATSVWASKIQGDLEERFDELQEASKDTGATSFTSRPKEGKPVTRIIIPKLKVDAIVVEGVTASALRAGAGHMPRSALPGDPTGNVVIAGHRTGFKGYFRHINKLKQGDRIELVTPFGKYTYSTMAPFDGHRNPWVTAPDDLSVTNITPEPSLTLITCDPPGSSKYRLILRARLVKSEPRV